MRYAEVAKLVDATALGAVGATCGGSSPLLGTNYEKNYIIVVNGNTWIRVFF